MAPARGSRGRGRAGRSPGASQAGGRRGSGSREGASGPHSPRSSLVDTLRVRAAVQQLRSPPESTTTALSTTHTPSALREAHFTQAAGRTGGGRRRRRRGRKTSMAPVRDPENVDDQIKDVIQHLFEVQSAVHGYLPETQGPLVDKITDLTQALSALRTLAASPTSSVAGIELPPEILDYVDGGRNPDVYTREFVELVQRGNAVLNGKQEAFKSFSEVFAQELARTMPETTRQVQRVMQNAGLRIRGNGEVMEGEEKEEEMKKKTQGQQRREGGGRQGNEGEEG